MVCFFFSNEKKLFTDLMERYELLGKHGRPVVDPTSEIFSVNFIIWNQISKILIFSRFHEPYICILLSWNPLQKCWYPTYPERPCMRTLKWHNWNPIMHSHSLDWLVFKVPKRTRKTSSVTNGIRCLWLLFLIWIIFSESISVYYGFVLVQLLAVDEKSQTIKTIVWNSYVSFLKIFQIKVYVSKSFLPIVSNKQKQKEVKWKLQSDLYPPTSAGYG